MRERGIAAAALLRAAVAAGLCLALAAGCSSPAEPGAEPSKSQGGGGGGEPSGGPSGEPSDGPTDGPGGRGGPECPGGFNLPKSVREFACDGVWVRPRPAALVPQGLTLGPGRTAYLTGYLAGPLGQRPCQVLKVDRLTGRTKALVGKLEGQVPGDQATYCRHGGGIGLNSDGLWVAETRRLWLLDPAAIDAGTDPVRRVWALDKPVRGSAMVVTADRIGLVGFTKSLPGKLRWYDVGEVLADGAARLGQRGGDDTVGPVKMRRTPSLIQGVTVGPGGAWFAQSHTRCGILTGPDGALEFIPGAEGIAFEDPHHVWVVSESGARRFQRMGDRPVIPTLTRIDIRELGESPGC